MDIGKLKNNTSFYEGYEGEGEVTFLLMDSPEYCLHIWDGYFEDIFGSPLPPAGPWHGFTRDYQQGDGVFGFNTHDVINDTKEYIVDLQQYVDKEFAYEESSECLQLILDFLKYAISSSEVVTVTLF